MAFTRHRRTVRGTASVLCLLGAFVLASGVRPLLAQGGGTPDADTKAMQSYRLTEASFSKYKQATRNMMEAARQHPEIAKAEEDKEPTSLAEMAAIYDRHPPLKKALASAGLSSREYVLFTLSLFQAGMAASVAEQNGGKLPDGVSSENVDFYKTHAAEMQKFGEEMKAKADAIDTSGAADTSSSMRR
jgi:hypothetical protein